ncbi:outer membrane protein assembly factor BamD [Ottowia sp.]|jgi:outer membrane protein assembly factor BamD|uniref:outer membrane protein assembly factor BamD n=1 Tax=Ottowia sp. TaxID=1898956 RepID=UPI002C79537D|nr:outer membrane protein assembly factor BamD [Ottowia sp.]HRN77185.1 outer membrane protein assembly factor BamD [Ottowia sp.]HRQ01877.1 outer membrane protein assembly factor BamD [Ottowia sp.]
MRGARLSAAGAAALLLAALLSACSSKPVDKTAGWSPNRIHAEARDELNSGAFDKAIPLYEALEGRAAGTPLAQQAQLDKAYAQFKDGQKAEALATLDRFMRLHPASPAIDYALYMKGVINFNDELGLFSFLARQDLSERDQKAAKEAFESFDELVKRFPDSRYAPDARARMRYTVNALAQYDVHVARYYYTRGAYVAAISRAQQAIADYRDAPALEEALYILVQSYDKLEMTALRDDARRVLDQNYPNSQYLARGFRGPDKPWWQLW